MVTPGDNSSPFYTPDRNVTKTTANVHNITANIPLVFLRLSMHLIRLVISHCFMTAVLMGAELNTMV